MHKIVVVALAFELLAVAAVPAHEGLIRARGTEVRLPVNRVDPYDPLRGYSVALNYPTLAPFTASDAKMNEGYIALERSADGSARPLRLVARRGDAGPLAIRVRLGSAVPWSSGVRTPQPYPDRWYVDQWEAARANEALRSGDAVAVLRVDGDGEASLVRVERRTKPPTG